MSPLIYFEDVEVGASYALGCYEMTADEVREFRRQWDPGVMRSSDVSAVSGEMAPMIASGMHSVAVQQRLAMSGPLADWAIVAGRRLREVDFRAVVRAGMTLAGDLVVDELSPRSARTGTVVFTVGLRHDDEVVLRVTHEAIMQRRPVARPGGESD